MGPRAGLDRCGKSRPHRDSIPDRPARSSVTNRLSYRDHIAVQYIHQSNREQLAFLFDFHYIRGTLLLVQLVEALHHKPEGRGFDSRWCQCNFSLT
jgi:hypothetical protein